MRRVWMGIAAALLLAAPSHASDVAAVVGPMKSEAAECRYLLNLCAREVALRAKFDQATNKAHDDLIAGTAWESVANDLAHAAQIIRNKHAKRPACFAKCAVLKDAPAFD